MNSVLLISVFICIATAASISNYAKDDTVAYTNNNDGSGNYEFSFETSNGITRSEVGELRNAGEKNQYIFVSGFYSYIDPEGREVKVYYIADEDGYKIVPSPIPVITPIAGAPPSVTATLLG
ncbi:endocuticle structural glycoprotein SgAbd-5-like [Achroia grisella]|uniref:endocuticle structural glycoprotein SgAbd-5-like n=1 Tax=Achroia grisella TaxID=688607 RepID=UPI0027D2B1F1|nr:endocuticle structural glycoprotein SgAbd-5-like [Achroia grisella]